MSAELQEFNDLIEDLKSVINQPNFDSTFKSKASGIPKAKQFLIKMELKRLAQPCNRLIDLRGNVVGTPEQYEHKGQIHYLDEIGKSIFEDQLEKFGQYTIGGYEAILNAENNHRVLHRVEQESRLAQKNSAPTPSVTKSQPVTQAPPIERSYGGSVVHFTEYGIRKEERMNFSINLELQFGLKDTTKAVSSDLSVCGIKVKVPSARQVVPGQKVAVYLTDLEKEFELGLKDGIQYVVVAVETAGTGYNYLRMKRTFIEDVVAFDEFLGKFITGNKHRYKVNLDNTLEAIVVKGYEQYYLPRVTSLPIYIRQIKDRLVPTMVLATENNRGTLGYFSDENKNLVFQQIINEKRLATLLNSEKEVKETILFCFTHAKAGKLYFYTATSEELETSATLKELFLGFGSRKDSWRVFKLQMLAADEKDAHIPLSIPRSASTEISKLHTELSPKVQGLLRNLTYMVLLTPLSDKNQAIEYQAEYQFKQSKVQLLTKFGHPKLKRYIAIEVETIDYVNLRSEDRFLYKTSVELEDPEQNVTLSGSTRDFSTNGLQVVLDAPGPYAKNDIIILALPEMQRVTSKYDLSKLTYEVVAISRDKTVMNLRIYNPKREHQAQRFFKKLIAQNRSKLTAAVMESRYPGLSQALRNLYARNICNMPIYFAKNSGKLISDTLGKGRQTNLFFNLLSQYKSSDSDVNLYPFLKDNALHSTFLPILQELQRTDRPRAIDLYVRYRNDQLSDEKSFICHYEDQFLSDGMLHSFVKASCKNDLFFAFRIFLCRTGRPDMDYVKKEINYVNSYAMHRAKELEEKLWSVTGVGDIVDISEEVMYRFGIPSNQIEQQIIKKNDLAL